MRVQNADGGAASDPEGRHSMLGDLGLKLVSRRLRWRRW